MEEWLEYEGMKAADGDADALSILGLAQTANPNPHMPTHTQTLT